MHHVIFELDLVILEESIALVLLSIGTDLANKLLLESHEVLLAIKLALQLLITTSSRSLCPSQVIHLVSLVEETRSEVLGVEDSNLLFVYDHE